MLCFSLLGFCLCLYLPLKIEFGLLGGFMMHLLNKSCKFHFVQKARLFELVYLNMQHGDIFMDFVVVDLDKGNEAEHNTVEVSSSILDGVEVQEPFVGMEFDSEEAARNFYVEYARRVGFVVRIMQRRRSGIDGRTLARRLGCNKQGFSPNNKGTFGPDKKPRPSGREGCKATILVKMEKSGKWVVTRFVKDHNHPLIITANGFSTEGDKDKKIEELTMELERQDKQCATYREKLLSFMNNVEEQTEELSTKIQVIIENVRKVESEVQKNSWNRKPRCLT